MRKPCEQTDQACVPPPGPVERGEEALENLFGAEVLPDLDLSSLPDSFQTLLGGDADPHDPAVQREVVQFIQSREGAAARRLLGRIVGDAEMSQLLQSAGSGAESEQPSPELRDKLEGAIHSLTSGAARKDLSKNAAEISFGKVKTVRHAELRVGRNDACPCGSGRKFKNCCLHKGP